MTHKILIACEESQRVCEAFRRRGFEAYSCDIIECSGGHPEWHIMGDALPILNGRCEFYTMDGVRHYIGRQWDLIVAHPPCTFLTNAGARHLYKGGVLNEERYAKGLEAKEFFMRFYTADCPRICIENPTPSRIFALPAASQVIQPYQFGHPYTKRTLLWQINLPPPPVCYKYRNSREDMVPQRIVFGCAQRKTQRDVYNGQSEKPQRNFPRHSGCHCGTVRRGA